MGKMDHLALIQILDKMAFQPIIVFLAGQGFLQGLKEHPIKLLNVLLQLGLIVFPLETLHQLASVDCAWKPSFQLCKQPLELVEDTVRRLGMNAIVVLPVVDGLSELGSHEEGLK